MSTVEAIAIIFILGTAVIFFFMRGSKQDRCDHLYNPSQKDEESGQECILCGKFNSLHDMGWAEHEIKYYNGKITFEEFMKAELGEIK